jgi:hypothetical protein
MVVGGVEVVVVLSRGEVEPEMGPPEEADLARLRGPNEGADVHGGDAEAAAVVAGLNEQRDGLVVPDVLVAAEKRRRAVAAVPRPEVQVDYAKDEGVVAA